MILRAIISVLVYSKSLLLESLALAIRIERLDK